MSGHTPGPWQWNNTPQGARLETPHSGRLIVLDCTRKGMQYAEPRFSDRGGERRGGIMHPASKIDLFDHPDARLLAAAPDLLAVCEEAYAALEAVYDYTPDGGSQPFGSAGDLLHKLDAAIARATGGDQ